MNRIITQDRRNRRRRNHHVFRKLRLLRTRARHPRDESAGRVRTAAGDARQRAAIHRTLQSPCRQSRASAKPHQGARQDRQDRTAEEAPGREVRIPRTAAIRRPGGSDRRSPQELRLTRDLRWLQPHHPTRRTLGRDGPERRGQDHASEDDRRRDEARWRHRAPRRQPATWDTSRSNRSTSSIPNLTVIEQLQSDFPQDGLGSLRTLAGAFQFSGDDVDKTDPGALGRREVTPRDGANALQSAELSGARRAHQSPGSRDKGNAGRCAQGIRRHDDLRVA